MFFARTNCRLALAALTIGLGCRATGRELEQPAGDEHLVADLVVRPQAIRDLPTRRASTLFVFKVVERRYVDPAALSYQRDPLAMRLLQGQNQEGGKDAIDRLREFLKEVPGTTAANEHSSPNTLFAVDAPLYRLVARRGEHGGSDWALVAKDGQRFHVLPEKP